jgi:DNA-directed RNA polymerase specialized sigma24 family protein
MTIPMLAAHAETAREIVVLVPALRRFATRFAKSSNDIDDLGQEGVCRALGHVDSFSAGTSLRSWMFTIMTAVRAADRDVAHAPSGLVACSDCDHLVVAENRTVKE